MIRLATAAFVVACMAGPACAQEKKGGKLPWFDGPAEEGLAKAMKEGKNAFLYFTSEG